MALEMSSSMVRVGTREVDTTTPVHGVGEGRCSGSGGGLSLTPGSQLARQVCQIGRQSFGVAAQLAGDVLDLRGARRRLSVQTPIQGRQVGWKALSSMAAQLGGNVLDLQMQGAVICFGPRIEWKTLLTACTSSCVQLLLGVR